MGSLLFSCDLQSESASGCRSRRPAGQSATSENILLAGAWWKYRWWFLWSDLVSLLLCHSTSYMNTGAGVFHLKGSVLCTDAWWHFKNHAVKCAITCTVQSMLLEHSHVLLILIVTSSSWINILVLYNCQNLKSIKQLVVETLYRFSLLWSRHFTALVFAIVFVCLLSWERVSSSIPVFSNTVYSQHL